MAWSDHVGNVEQKVTAEQLEETRAIITPNGAVNGQPGDWEVRYSDGNVAHLTDEQFQEAFGSGKVGTEAEKSKGPSSDTTDGKDDKSGSAERSAGDSEEDTATPESPSQDSSKTGSEKTHARRDTADDSGL